MSRRLLPVVLMLALAGCVPPPPPPPAPQVAHFAPPERPALNLGERLAMDQQRINEAVRGGQLTPPEANELEGRYTAIDNARQQALAQGGGRFPPGQYEQLLSREDALSHSIFVYRHNGATPNAH